MTSTERYNMLLKDLLDDGVVIETKASKWYWRALAGLLFVVSFGKIRFMETSVTTIGNRIGTPSDWESWADFTKYEVLLHEAVHIRQYKRYGFGKVWLGIIPVGFAYLFLPFPVGIAYCRARLEWEGYEASIRAILQVGGLTAALESKYFIVSQFTSANYLYMWPFKSQVEKWFDEAVRRIAIEEGVIVE